MIIYKITNLRNSKIYIGSVFDRPFNSRTTEHKYRLNANTHHNIYLQRSWNKYGEKFFKWEIVCQYFCITKEELNNYEKYYISFYKSNNKDIGYNLTNGGEGLDGFEHTEETKLSMSKNRRGKKVSDETRHKIHISSIGKNKGKLPWNSGKKNVFSKETLEKMSKSLSGKVSPMRGKKHSEETKKKISCSKKGIKLSNEHKEKLKEVSKGRKHSEETKKKISLSHKGIPSPLKGRSSPLKGRKLSEEHRLKSIETLNKIRLLKSLNKDME